MLSASAALRDHGNLRAYRNEFVHKTFFISPNKLKFNSCAIYDGNAASDPDRPPAPPAMTVRNYAANTLQAVPGCGGQTISDLYHSRYESSLIRE